MTLFVITAPQAQFVAAILVLALKRGEQANHPLIGFFVVIGMIHLFLPSLNPH